MIWPRVAIGLEFGSSIDRLTGSRLGSIVQAAICLSLVLIYPLIAVRVTGAWCGILV